MEGEGRDQEGWIMKPHLTLNSQVHRMPASILFTTTLEQKQSGSHSSLIRLFISCPLAVLARRIHPHPFRLPASGVGALSQKASFLLLAAAGARFIRGRPQPLCSFGSWLTAHFSSLCCSQVSKTGEAGVVQKISHTHSMV
ncbi:hypothetical protein GUJ93_ZPchr0006g45007 [Zizania palustris]|uniref:Uncharacterized protein n=1 Tax=Zizania palustris TaxID=103762 RepID=A0A8J5SJF8_ZIZPA|nr:hypothetical protein GUJ93_ZPchr0006g45007 [Zizania palustris]